MIKKFFIYLFQHGPYKTSQAVFSVFFKNNLFLNRLKLRFFIYLHNKSYSRITSLVRRLNKGVHPKRKIMGYEKFFLNNISPEDSVLDIGCHEGYLSKAAAKICQKVVGIDNNLKSIVLAEKGEKISNLSFVFGDATSFDFSCHFNKIILSNVLEHIENRIVFLEKLKQLSDTILLRVPLLTRDWLVVYKKENGFEYRLDPTHFIEYTLEELKKELEESGWKIENYSVNFGEFWGILKCHP